jgi:PAS domain S-box-containing protein
MDASGSAGLDHDRSRRALYDIVEDDGRSLTEKRAAVLELGTAYLDVDLGYVSTVDTEAGTLEIRASTDEAALPAGATFDLDETYCQQCIENNSPLAVADAPAEGWGDHPSSAKHGLDCYLGTPLRVGGELVGTLCFADEFGREAEFSPPERAFVELAARVFGREREAAEYERELERRERDLERRERELDRAERKYEALVERAPDAIFLAEMDTGRIVEANEAALALTGYDREGLIGTAVESFSPGQGSDYWAAFERAHWDEEGPVGRFEDGSPVRIERADGTTVPVEISISRLELAGETYVQGIVRDVSERRERQEELRLKNRAVDEAPVGITIAEATGDEPLVFANERFQALTGYDWPELAGTNCRRLQGPGTEAEPVAAIRAALEAERPVQEELLNYRADGTPFWNELLIAPVPDDDGETTHYVGFQRDITERKRKERLIRVLNRVLRHDLRNGMNVVMARAQQLRQRGDGDTDALDTIIERAEELVATSERAREIGEAVRNERSVGPTDAAELVETVAADLRASSDAEVRTRTPERQSALGGGMLRAALTELGRNAARHAGPGATITFEVERVDGAVAIRVHDDGPGLPPEERRVLDQGDETPLEHSSGLGLWFVNWVVTGLGGRVTATVDDGTTVSVFLPDGDAADGQGRQTAFGR